MFSTQPSRLQPCLSPASPAKALLFASSLALIAFTPAAAQQEATIDGKQVILVLTPDAHLEMAEMRQFAQEQTRRKFGVDTDFRFDDRLAASGITFRHEITDDSGLNWKPVHYDHGNGLGVADVDGDGHLDLYFLTQIGSNELWRGRGDGTFENITERAGVGLAERISVTCSFADYDDDGDPDLFVTTVRMGNVLFRNEGGGRFTDVTAEAGLGHVGHSSGATFFDYDLDGDLDLFLANVGVYSGSATGRGGAYVGFEDAFSGHEMPHRTENSILYRNDGGKFVDVSEETGLVDGGWTGDATFFDANGDRYPDLLAINMQGDDRLWINEGGRKFVDRTKEILGKTPFGTMGVEFFDWDGDGDLDLYLTDMHSDMQLRIPPGFEKDKAMMKPWREQGAPNIYGNAFYRNEGDGRFTEISDDIGAENYWPWGLTVADLNADGWEDAFLASSMNYPFRYGVNSVLLNDRGEMLRDAEFLVGVEPRDGNPRTPWFELDCDGDDARHRLCAERSGRWTVYASKGSRSSAIIDIDSDGDLDIVTTEFNDVPQVLVSDLSDRRAVNWVGVRLQGTRSNRDGLGAIVRVTAGGRTLTQQVDGKSGYLTQSSLPLYFGLGEATGVDRIEVRWPSGAVQTVDATAGEVNLIVEPEG
ncbi:MAG: hypothetical protein DWQ30_01840 [Acidobacteria bacterium]|nr:MAG: hypothetical protein DWQ30_01840 [Acidobacteriota bacterium]